MVWTSEVWSGRMTFSLMTWSGEAAGVRRGIRACHLHSVRGSVHSALCYILLALRRQSWNGRWSTIISSV
jgi:hypothetical protein